MGFVSSQLIRIGCHHARCSPSRTGVAGRPPRPVSPELAWGDDDAGCVEVRGDVGWPLEGVGVRREEAPAVRGGVDFVAHYGGLVTSAHGTRSTQVTMR
jgi:hypothetical protein